MEVTSELQYDFFVIGGGSGGLAASKAAVELGARVGLADFVKPSTQGTTWGLGGTCVNVGCIPKKLMHFASSLGHLREDQRDFGFEDSTKIQHNWNSMLEKINNHIRSLNWQYKSTLAVKEINYFNALASIISPNTIELTFKNNQKQVIRSKYILIATGGRPSILNVPGARECCITSDDIFWQQTPPGKCLIVGAGYIGLECGGFLCGMGYQVDLLYRDKILRGFDPEMVQSVVDFMAQYSKIKFLQGNPVNFEKIENRIKATFVNDKNEEFSEVYDTVLMAVGRYPDLKNIGLDKLNIKLDKFGKVIVNEQLESSVDGVFAIGDIVSGGRELTPVAIKQGINLVKGLFANKFSKIDLKSVATTVFTPLEYSFSGYSEDEAIAEFGKDKVTVYFNEFAPIEWKKSEHKRGLKCRAKVIVLKSNDIILGIHYTGLNAGELVQGLSVSVRLGLTYSQLKSTFPVDSSSGFDMIHMQNRDPLVF